MPIQIVNNNNGATSPKDGTIKQNDLCKMKHDFKKQIGLTAIPPRYVVEKKYSFYFAKAQFEKLFEYYQDNPNVDAVEVSIGVQRPNTIVKCLNDGSEYNISNSLSAIISMATKATLEPKNDVEDFILIDGYKNIEPAILQDGCCPGSKPPPYENE